MPVPDPYRDPASPVLLTGPFVTTTATSVHPGGARARYALAQPLVDRVLASFTIPCLLLDGMIRLSVLGNGHPPAAAVGGRANRAVRVAGFQQPSWPSDRTAGWWPGYQTC